MCGVVVVCGVLIIIIIYYYYFMQQLSIYYIEYKYKYAQTAEKKDIIITLSIIFL